MFSRLPIEEEPRSCLAFAELCTEGVKPPEDNAGIRGLLTPIISARGLTDRSRVWSAYPNGSLCTLVRELNGGDCICDIETHSALWAPFQ